MAISKSFFGLRRGSTKSLTFSIFQGKQVTKDRVAFVKNPNTIAQRLQRMKFLAMQLLLNAGLGDIIDHSWENKKYGSESRQYFSSKALKLSGPFIGKDQEVCVPMPVQVSEGNLVPIEYSLPTGGSGSSNAAASIILEVFNDETGAPYFSAGEQLTFICVYNGLVLVERVIITKITPASGDVAAVLEATIDGTHIKANTTNIRFDVPESANMPWAKGAIRSKYINGKWQRSTQSLIVNELAEEAYYTADAMNVAVQSWDTKANENMLSNWYLNLSDSVYDGADVVISVKTQSGGSTKVRARMVNVQGELIPYIYTSTGTAAGYCITAAGARSSVLGSAIVGAIGFVQWGTLGNSTGNNNGAQGGSTDPVMP